MTVGEETRPEVAAERECPACGSPAADGQEYCLECGARLPLPAARGAVVGGAPPWLWPVLFAGVVAICAAAAAVAYRTAQDDTIRPVLVPATATMGTLTPTEESAPEQTAPTLSEPPTTAPPPTQAPPTTAPPAPNRLIAWPAGTSGFTIVLASLPQEGGRPAATARAREAADAGLRQVGVLNSDQYGSLHPGYFVVFSGVYDSRAEAEGALGDARSAGFETPYVREIAS